MTLFLPDKSDRWKRAIRLLNKRSGILRELADTHHLEVRSLSEFNFASGTILLHLLHLKTLGIAPTPGAPTWPHRSGDHQRPTGKRRRARCPRSAAVILSDGFHNSGASPFETAASCLERHPRPPLVWVVNFLLRPCRSSGRTSSQSPQGRPFSWFHHHQGRA